MKRTNATFKPNSTRGKLATLRASGAVDARITLTMLALSALAAAFAAAMLVYCVTL